MIIHTNAGPYQSNRQGRLDNAARCIFSYGHCHSLALALNKLTAWPLCGMGFNFYDDKLFTDMPGHIFVKAPGCYVDIHGPMQWHSVYSDVRVMDLKEVRHWISLSHLGGYRKPDLRLAMPYARTLLQTHFPALHFPIATFKGRK